jgi:predicted nucleotidyltransferase
MPHTVTSSTQELPLTEVIARLAANETVTGLLTIGSTGRGALSPASDYDLVVVLRNPPLPLRVALTWVAGRLTDIVYVDAVEIAAVLCPGAGASAPIWGEEAVLRWLRSGQVVFDRSGELAQAQVVAMSKPEAVPSAGDVYSAWFSINYNLAQNRRMAAATDPVYLTALDLRLLYSLFDVWWYYFLLRHLTPRGEKAQVRYMMVHDPEFLELFRACLAEGERGRKFGMYEELAQRSVATAGGLWPENATAVQPETGPGWTQGAVEAALDFWERLIAA